MMRSRVVLPHPDGPSSTRNSPSFAVRVMPSTAVTGPKAFLISLAVTEATFSSTASMKRRNVRSQTIAVSSTAADAWGFKTPEEASAAVPSLRSSALGPLFVDEVDLIRCPLDGFLGRGLAGGRPRHHVGDDEIVGHLIGRR